MKLKIYSKVKKIYYRWAPTEQVIRMQFKKRLNREPELNEPVLFTDKLQWLKLNWKDPFATKMADKYSVREIISETIGEHYLNKLHAVYNSVDEIEISKLPDSFVLKGTHGSGFNLICKNKNKINWHVEKRKMKKWFQQNYYWEKREWVYKDIKPRIICEYFLKDDDLNSTGLVDFKFYCFNGEPHYCQVIQNRGLNETIDFYNMDWEHMPFTGMRLLPNSEILLERPVNFDDMKNVSRKLSKGFPFVRVDLYYVNKKVIFGEMTFFPTSGMGKFNPPEWDKKMGELLKLPKGKL